MKTILSLFCISVIALSACTKKNAAKLEDNLVDGTWKANYYLSDGQNKINKLVYRDFLFLKDGKLKVTVSGIETEGSWSVETKGLTERTNSVAKYVLNIDIASPYEGLKKTWYVKSTDENSIDLFEFENSATTVGEIKHTDLLSFEKK
jgi:hypothetical protein